MIQRFASGLFRRHVGYRSHGRAWVRELIISGDRCRSLIGPMRLRRKLRQAEVKNFGLSPLRDENIRRLNIAMYDPGRVGSVQRVRYLDSQIQQLADLEGTALDPVLECLSFQKLHRDERDILESINLVDGADVRMVQCRSGASLTLKSLNRLRISGESLRKKLQSYKTSQLCVLCLVDHTHTAAPKLFQHAVMRDGSTDQLTCLRAPILVSRHNEVKVIGK